MASFDDEGSSRLGKPKVLLGGMTENPGGKESFIMQAFESLRHEYECWFLVDRTIAFQDEISSKGGVIYKVPRRGRSPIAYVRRLDRLFSEVHFEAIWMNQTVVNSIEPLYFARRHGVATRVLHSHSSANMTTRVGGALHYLQRPFLGSLVTHRFACSTPAGVWFFGSKGFETVPNAFDVSRFTFSETTRENTRESLGIDTDTHVLIQVASLNPVKNHSFSLSVLQQMLHQGNDAVLLLVGEGPLRSAITDEAETKRISNRVKILGARNDVPALLSASDLLILPSKFEGLPYAVLEGQASELPCLISDKVSPEVCLTDLVERLSLDIGAGAWAREVMRMIRSAPPRLSENPLEKTKFDAQENRTKYLELLRYR